MSITSTALYCVTAVLVPAILYQSAGAVPRLSELNDRDRAVLTFNPASDPCTRLDESSDQAEIDAADWACREAFLALDRIDANTCRGYRKPGCRQFDDYICNMCSCQISAWTRSEIRSDITKSFRECTWEFWMEEIGSGQALPSASFRRASIRIENDLQASRSSRVPFHAGGSSGAQTSFEPITSYGAGALYFPDTSYDAAGLSALTTGSGMNEEVMEVTEPDPDPDPGKPHKCGICRKGYGSKESLRQHTRGHRKSTTCTICNKPFSTTSNLYAHINVAHKQGSGCAPGGVTKGAGGKAFDCILCGRQYKTAKTLKEHRKSHLENLSCKICNNSYSSRRHLNKHIKDAHPGNEAVASGAGPALNADFEDAYNAARPHVCGPCGKRYTTQETLRQHTLSHTTQSTTCTLCNRVYSTTSSFHLHMRSQHKNKQNRA